MAKCGKTVTIIRDDCYEIHHCAIDEDEHTEEDTRGGAVHKCECGKEWGDTECD